METKTTESEIPESAIPESAIPERQIRSYDAHAAQRNMMDSLRTIERFYVQCIAQLEKHRSPLNENTHQPNLQRYYAKMNEIARLRAQVRRLLE